MVLIECYEQQPGWGYGELGWDIHQWVRKGLSDKVVFQYCPKRGKKGMKSFRNWGGKVKEEMGAQLPTALCAVSWTWASALNDVRNHWKT